MFYFFLFFLKERFLNEWYLRDLFPRSFFFPLLVEHEAPVDWFQTWYKQIRHDMTQHVPNLSECKPARRLAVHATPSKRSRENTELPHPMHLEPIDTLSTGNTSDKWIHWWHDLNDWIWVELRHENHRHHLQTHGPHLQTHGLRFDLNFVTKITNATCKRVTFATYQMSP